MIFCAFAYSPAGKEKSISHPENYQISSTRVQVEVVKAAVRTVNREAADRIMKPVEIIFFVSLSVILAYAFISTHWMKEFWHMVFLEKYRVQRSYQALEYESEHLF